MAEIIVKLDKKEVDRYTFDGDEIEIGRGDANDIKLKNLSVSRRHARIIRDQGHYYVEDLNSANGTYVNGKRVVRAQVFHEDQVIIGKHVLIFHAPDSEFKSQYDDIQETVMLGPDEQMPSAPPMDETGPQEDFMFSESESEEGAPASLRVRSAGNKDFYAGVHLGVTRIGRSPESKLRLLDWFVDQNQAQIIGDESGFRIRNLSEVNPTLLNGEPVQEAKLQSGDQIHLGISRILFEYSEMPLTGEEVPEDRPVGDDIGGMAAGMGEEEPFVIQTPSESVMDAEPEQLGGPAPIPLNAMEEENIDDTGEVLVDMEAMEDAPVETFEPEEQMVGEDIERDLALEPDLAEEGEEDVFGNTTDVMEAVEADEGQSLSDEILDEGGPAEAEMELEELEDEDLEMPELEEPSDIEGEIPAEEEPIEVEAEPVEEPDLAESYMDEIDIVSELGSEASGEGEAGFPDEEISSSSEDMEMPEEEEEAPMTGEAEDLNASLDEELGSMQFEEPASEAEPEVVDTMGESEQEFAPVDELEDDAAIDEAFNDVEAHRTDSEEGIEDALSEAMEPEDLSEVSDEQPDVEIEGEDVEIEDVEADETEEQDVLAEALEEEAAAAASSEAVPEEIAEQAEEDSGDQELSEEERKRVKVLEKSLNNPSAIVRKHVAEQLKKLTGRDYEY
ncbi:MAG: FHA domain-containing protein [bacterium]